MKFLWVIIFTLFSQFVVANDVSLQPQVEIGELYVTHESSSEFTVANVQQLDDVRWRPVSQGVNSGIMGAGVWAKFKLHYIEAVPSKRLLVVDNTQLNTLDVYMVKQGELLEVWRLGNRYRFNQRPVSSRNFAIPISLDPNTEYTFYLRMTSDLGVQAKVSVQQEAHFWLKTSDENMVLGSYLGMLILFVLLNLAAYLLSNHYLHLLLALDLFCFGALHASHLGVGFQYLWPSDPAFDQLASLLFAFLTIFFATIFSWRFLASAQSPLGWNICRLLMLASLLGGAGLWLFSREVMSWYCALLVIATSVFLSVLIVIAWGRKKDPDIVYLSFSYLLACLAFIAYALQEIGWVPVSHLSEYAIAYGVLLQGLILTLVLIKRRSRKVSMKSSDSLIELPQQVREWVAQFSHEIRTPLNGVLGMADLLKETPLNPTQYSYIRSITSSGDHLLGVLNDVLDFESLAAGKVSLQLDDFDIAELIDEACSLFEQAAIENQVAIVQEIPASIPAVMRGDAKRIKQVVVNLLSNAIKFTHEGKVVIRLAYNPEGSLTIEVEDNGIGLTDRQMEKIFGRFEQANPGVYQRFGGSGLGLAICQQLIVLMGGEIDVESKLGRYALFRVSLPLQSGDSAEIEEQEEPSMMPEGILPTFGQQLNILAVDDNEVNRKVVSAMLNKLGHNVELACSGKEAIELIVSGRHYDLVLMDCEMPEMDGYQATREIRHWQYGQAAKPCSIVALTAHAMDEHKEECVEAGMDGYLSKPIRLHELKELTDQLRQLRTPS